MMSYPITTTLNRIYVHDPCPEGWQRGLSAAGKTAPDDEPITYEAILEAVGLENALWCCRAEPQYSNEWRRFAVWCARQVQHLMDDQRSIDALDAAEAHSKGLITDEELAAARAVAWDVVSTVPSVVTMAIAWYVVSTVASVVTRAIAWDAAWTTANTVADAVAWITWTTASADASIDARDAARDAQAAAFRQLATTGTLPPIANGANRSPV